MLFSSHHSTLKCLYFRVCLTQISFPTNFSLFQSCLVQSVLSGNYTGPYKKTESNLHLFSTAAPTTTTQNGNCRKGHCWGTKTAVYKQFWTNRYEIHANLWFSTRRTSCHCTAWTPISLSDWQDFFYSQSLKQLFTSEGFDSSHLETVEKNNKYEASGRNHNVLK